MTDYKALVRALIDGEALRERTVTIQLYGAECRCLDLETLLSVKRAAGRPKDLEAIAELEALVEERRRPGGR